MINQVLTATALLAALSIPAAGQSGMMGDTTGKVHSTTAVKTEVKVNKSLASTAKVSADSAYVLARAHGNYGEVSSSELEMVNGRLAYEVKLLNAKKKLSTVIVDAMSGEVVNAKKHGGMRSRLGHHKENKKLLDAKRDSAATRP